MMMNCIFWKNSDAGGMDESAQIHVSEFGVVSVPVVMFSNIQGGWTGAGGLGNIDADPFFLDPDNGDFRLAPGSPSIDAGDNDAVPADVTTDLAGHPRFVDNVISPDTGNPGAAGPPIVDMGAFETPATVPADLDLDGDVDGNDFVFFSACFNKAGNPPRAGCSPHQAAAFDFDDDTDVDGLDFAQFAQCYNKADNPPRTLGCPQN
jgi:hypothetical protein